MGEEKYLLKWNDFRQNLSEGFKRFRREEVFYDVSLVCGNQGEQILQAHKVMLCSSSNFFQSVLMRNPHSHPLLYLKGIRPRDLASILDYIYHGETNVALGDLDSFLEVAADLQIKGLMTPGSSTSDRLQPPAAPSGKKPRRSSQSRVDIVEDDGERKDPAPPPPTEVKKEYEMQVVDEEEDLDQLQSPEFDSSGSTYEYCQTQGEEARYGPGQGDQGYAANSSAATEVKRLTDQYLARQDDGRGGVMWACTCCGKTARMKHHVREHIESNHIDCLTFACPFCSKEIKNRVALRSHISKNHREENLRSKGLVA